MNRDGAGSNRDGCSKLGACTAYEDFIQCSRQHEAKRLLVHVRHDGRHEVALLGMDILKLPARMPDTIGASENYCPGFL